MKFSAEYKVPWFPSGLENRDTWEMGRHFPVGEIFGNFVKTGKVGVFYSEVVEKSEENNTKI